MGEQRQCPRRGCRKPLRAPATVYEPGHGGAGDLRPFGMKRAYCSSECLMRDWQDAKRRQLQAPARRVRIHQEVEKELGS